MRYPRERRSISPPNTGSPSRGRRSISPSRSRRSRSRSHELEDAINPGNNLYVTGLSSRVTQGDLERYFSNEGKVLECQLVIDPRTKESRGFGFVMMETNESADRCVKYLNRSVLEGRLISVEKAKRKRGRTPTPGRYQGIGDKRGGQNFGGRGGGGGGGRGGGRRRSRSYSPPRRQERETYAREPQVRSRSPNRISTRAEDYASFKRRREPSPSPGGRGFH